MPRPRFLAAKADAQSILGVQAQMFDVQVKLLKW
jgi:hypothetical protein